MRPTFHIVTESTMPDTHKKLSGKTLGFSLTGLGLLLFVLVLINLSFSGLRLRWDATEDKIHSLSPGTKNILASFEETITLKYYFSDDPIQMPPHIRAYGRRVGDLLREYETLSKGRIRLEILHPEMDSEEEDWAKAYGVQALPTATGENLFLGLVALSQDKEEVLPFLDPAKETSLEYDITRTLAQLARSRERHIGIVSGLDVLGRSPMPGMGGGGPWFFVKELEKFATLHPIDAQTRDLPPNLDLLMLIQPGQLSPDLLFAIDTFVTSGGNLLIFSDPAAISDPMALYGAPENPLNPLFSAWGIEVSDTVVVDFHAATRLMGQNNQVENNPSWLSLDADAIRSDHLITAGLSSLLLPMAGSVHITESSPLEARVLLSSSPNAAPMDPALVRMGIESLRRNFQATGQSYVMAVHLTGPFPVAFPDGPPESPLPMEEDLGDPENQKKNPPAPSPASQEARILKPASLVLITDADLLFDAYYMSRQNFLGFEMARIFNDNLNFVLNSVEMLSGSPELIHIRTRDVMDRPFSRVRDLERQAETRWLAQEQALLRKAEEASARIQALERQKQGAETLVLTEAQETELRRFNEEKIRINKELKQVRRNLRADIDALGVRMKILNLLAMPLLVILLGLFVAYKRRKKTRHPL
jgi:ABC-type uncharacterized transport system involved in gliding motility auxiliary subunit